MLVSAGMHAGWNSVVKIGLDRFSVILLLSLAQGLQSLVLLWFFPAPAMAAWPLSCSANAPARGAGLRPPSSWAASC